MPDLVSHLRQLETLLAVRDAQRSVAQSAVAPARVTHVAADDRRCRADADLKDAVMRWEACLSGGDFDPLLARAMAVDLSSAEASQQAMTAEEARCRDRLDAAIQHWADCEAAYLGAASPARTVKRRQRRLIDDRLQSERADRATARWRRQ